MKTVLDWSSYKDAGMGDAYADIPQTGGDFAKAVSVCINSQQCETKEQGVMCPSFRVTGKAELSTGGRVRLLKAALNGGLGSSPFIDPNLGEAMDLCVACKGCKRECENEVDMAMIKIEYLAQRLQETRPGLRAVEAAAVPGGGPLGDGPRHIRGKCEPVGLLSRLHGLPGPERNAGVSGHDRWRCRLGYGHGNGRAGTSAHHVRHQQPLRHAGCGLPSGPALHARRTARGRESASRNGDAFAGRPF